MEEGSCQIETIEIFPKVIIFYRGKFYLVNWMEGKNYY